MLIVLIDGLSQGFLYDEMWEIAKKELGELVEPFLPDIRGQKKKPHWIWDIALGN